LKEISLRQLNTIILLNNLPFKTVKKDDDSEEKEGGENPQDADDSGHKILVGDFLSNDEIQCFVPGNWGLLYFTRAIVIISFDYEDHEESKGKLRLLQFQ
jgi:hypothetical protein